MTNKCCAGLEIGGQEDPEPMLGEGMVLLNLAEFPEDGS